ncbi:hypothetical protein [Ensifer sp. SSB1]|nr:hypothetical protein [Ensifer sp. SSB1]MBK5571272.1 hypothetical protein [Ensifer sp. SSB1]
MPLPPDLEAAVATVAKEHGITKDEAIVLILRDWLTGGGYIPLPSED